MSGSRAFVLKLSGRGVTTTCAVVASPALTLLKVNTEIITTSYGLRSYLPLPRMFTPPLKLLQPHWKGSKEIS
jgi:hypothetical protein